MSQLLRNKSTWITLGILAVVLFYFRSAATKKADSTLGEVTRGDLIQRVTIAGTVNPNRKTIISAPYAGYVKNLYVKTGQMVKAGDPIVTITQSLRGSEEEVFPMRAPFPGLVVQVLKTEGEFVETTSGYNTIVRIDDLSRIYVEASAPELEVGKLKVGLDAIFKASAILDKTYHGKVQNIALAAKEQRDWDKSRVEFAVLMEVSDKDAQIKPGMSVVADIIIKQLNNVLTIRHEYIQKDGEKYYVTTEKGVRKQIEVGLQNEEVFEVKKGVVEGEKLKQTDFLSLVRD